VFYVCTVLFALDCYDGTRFVCSAQIKNKAINVLSFWKSSKAGRHGRRSSANSTPSLAASISVEGAFGQARETVQQQRTTADVTAVPRPSSLRRPRQGSTRRSPTPDDVCPEKDKTPTAAAGLCMDRSVQTTDELLQPLIGNGLRRRHRPAVTNDATSPVHQADSLEDLVGGVCRPWRRHSLSSLSPLSSRLASPVHDTFETHRPPVGDLNLDDVLGDRGGGVSPGSLSPLSITEMTSPPRRWRRFELRGPGTAGGAFPLRCYDADNGRHWGAARLPPYQKPNYIVGMPPEPARTTAPPPQRAPLRRQKPCLGAIKIHSTGSGQSRGIVAGVGASPASSGSSGAAAGGRDDAGDSSEGAGVKSQSTLSLEDAISRSMSRMSDDDNVGGRGRRITAVPLSDITYRGVARNGVTRNDVTGTGRSSAVTSRRPARPVVLSSDV